MKLVFELIFSFHIVLSLSFLGLWTLRKLSLRFTGRQWLGLHYVVLCACVLSPFLFLELQVDSPFSPIVRFEGEAPTLGATMNIIGSHRLVGVDSHQSSVQSQTIPYTAILLFSLLTLQLIYSLTIVFKYFRGRCQLRQFLEGAILYKRIFGCSIWLYDGAKGSFTFYRQGFHIVLPKDLILSPQRLKLSLSHEIGHIRQGDPLWAHFSVFLKSIFGWNPLFAGWLHEISFWQEVASDEAVLQKQNVSIESYSRCLLDAAIKQQEERAVLTGAVGMAFSSQQLKRRVINMYDSKKKLTKKVVVATAVFAMIGSSGLAWATKGALGSTTLTLKEAKRLALQVGASQDIPIVVDQNVLYWLNHALRSEASRRGVREALQRMEGQRTMIESKLEQANLPIELLAVPLVESGYRNEAYSSMKAAGIWQFIASTARRCGLKVNSRVDERRNPVRLTDAAVCYYTKLHAIFQNWHVALAAYNFGEHHMVRAISTAGHNDVFRLGREGQLGREGKNYLSKIMAGMIILKNPQLVQ